LKHLLLILLCAAAALAAAEPAVPIPPGEVLLGHLRHEHPRLLASKDDFARLRREIPADARLNSWYQDVRQQAENILEAAPARYEIPDGLRLLATSRRVLERVYTLALVYQISGDRRFAQRAWAELKAAGEFKDWNPRHFLDTAEMTHAFAIGYDWLYDVWTPEQRAFLRQAMVEKGLNPGLAIERKKTWWAVLSNNWNQVCNGGLSMGALALADEEPALCGEFLHDALTSVQISLAGFAPDGGWDEGPGYWHYATSYEVTLLAALDSALGSDFGLAQIPGFADTGLFPIYMTSPARHLFNFADAHDRRLDSPQLFWLARKFHRPEFAAFAQGASRASVQGLLWFMPAAQDSLDRLPLDKYFRHAEAVTLRGDWRDSNATFVGFKAGSNRASHGHLDLGSFVLDALGERWAADPGPDDYNLPGYFGKARHTYYRLRAEGHNTLVLDPSSGDDQAASADTRIIRFDSKPARAFAIADLTAAYASHAQKVWRGIALLDRTNVLVEDEIQAARPAELYWLLHTPAKIQISGPRATLTLGRKHLCARILGPAGAAFEQMQAEPLPASPHPPGQAGNPGLTELAIHLTNVQSLRLTVLLTPEAEAAQPSNPAPLNDW
jgi:hypothetical protein